MKECVIVHRLHTEEDGRHTASIRITDVATGEVTASRTIEYSDTFPRSRAAGLSMDEAFRLAAEEGFEHAKEISTNQ